MYIELSRYQCPSEYVANICALDSISNTIKVWNAGTGHFIGEKVISEKNFKGFEFHNEWQECTLVIKDRKTQFAEIEEIHKVQREKELFNARINSSDKGSMMRKTDYSKASPKSEISDSSSLDFHKRQEDIKKELVDQWRKIRVLENGVVIMKEFNYNLKEGSKIYVSGDNNMLLDFTPNRIEIRAIRTDG